MPASLGFLAEVFKSLWKKPWRHKLWIHHLIMMGNQSLFLILLAGFFTGYVFAFQLRGVFSLFQVDALTGGATGLALTRELAPLMTAFVLAGRVGSSTAAEVATMVTHEQIDALEAMGIDPIHYLVVPRVWAALMVMPLLCGFFVLVGMVAAYGLCTGVYGMDEGLFLQKLLHMVSLKDLKWAYGKMLIFALVIVLVSSYQGFMARPGASGVGLATTKAVVHILILVLFLDFFMGYFFLNGY